MPPRPANAPREIKLTAKAQDTGVPRRSARQKPQTTNPTAPGSPNQGPWSPPTGHFSDTQGVNAAGEGTVVVPPLNPSVEAFTPSHMEQHQAQTTQNSEEEFSFLSLEELYSQHDSSIVEAAAAAETQHRESAEGLTSDPATGQGSSTEEAPPATPAGAELSPTEEEVPGCAQTEHLETDPTKRIKALTEELNKMYVMQRALKGSPVAARYEASIVALENEMFELLTHKGSAAGQHQAAAAPQHDEIHDPSTEKHTLAITNFDETDQLETESATESDSDSADFTTEKKCGDCGQYFASNLLHKHSSSQQNLFCGPCITSWEQAWETETPDDTIVKSDSEDESHHNDAPASAEPEPIKPASSSATLLSMAECQVERPTKPATPNQKALQAIQACKKQATPAQVQTHAVDFMEAAHASAGYPRLQKGAKLTTDQSAQLAFALTNTLPGRYQQKIKINLHADDRHNVINVLKLIAAEVETQKNQLDYATELDKARKLIMFKTPKPTKTGAPAPLAAPFTNMVNAAYTRINEICITFGKEFPLKDVMQDIAKAMPAYSEPPYHPIFGMEVWRTWHDNAKDVDWQTAVSSSVQTIADSDRYAAVRHRSNKDKDTQPTHVGAAPPAKTDRSRKETPNRNKGKPNPKQGNKFPPRCPYCHHILGLEGRATEHTIRDCKHAIDKPKDQCVGCGGKRDHMLRDCPKASKPANKPAPTNVTKQVAAAVADAMDSLTNSIPDMMEQTLKKVLRKKKEQD